MFNKIIKLYMTFVTLSLIFVTTVTGPVTSFAEPMSQAVSNIEEYFPDQKGNEWTYRGRFIDGQMVQIAEKSFTNVSTVMGNEVLDGMEMVVFHDTNPGDQGPSDSYYRRDVAGIRYFGSKPGTVLEKQLIPYQIVGFPLEVPSSFQQLDRKGLDLGLDLDRDGESEKVDVQAVVSVLGKETVVVPLGTYPEAIRLEARMTMHVHLSQAGLVVKGTDIMTAWFGRGIGLLKYEERQTIPSLRSENDRTIEVIEELEKATVQGQAIAGNHTGYTATGRLAKNSLRHVLP